MAGAIGLHAFTIAEGLGGVCASTAKAGHLYGLYTSAWGKHASNSSNRCSFNVMPGQLCSTCLHKMNCSYSIRGAMNLQLQVWHLNRPSSKQGARGSPWPPLGREWSIDTHHRKFAPVICSLQATSFILTV